MTHSQASILSPFATGQADDAGRWRFSKQRNMIQADGGEESFLLGRLIYRPTARRTVDLATSYLMMLLVP